VLALNSHDIVGTSGEMRRVHFPGDRERQIRSAGFSVHNHRNLQLGSEKFEELYSQLPELPDKASPARVRGHKPRILKDDENRIRAALAAHPNATIAGLCELVKAAGGASASVHVMGRELKRLNLSVRSKGPQVRTRILQADDDAKIRAIMGEHPDATLAELCAALKDVGGPSVSLNTMRKALMRLKLRAPKQRSQ
jgi:hypothetical protein